MALIQGVTGRTRPRPPRPSHAAAPTGRLTRDAEAAARARSTADAEQVTDPARTGRRVRGMEGGRAPSTNPLPSSQPRRGPGRTGFAPQREGNRSTLGQLAYHGAAPGNWMMDMYKGAESTVGGLMDLAGNTAKYGSPAPGVSLGDFVGESARELKRNITDPVGYANRDPFGFATSVLGGAAGAVKYAPQAARIANRVDWTDETGAINHAGKMLEEGDFRNVRLGDELDYSNAITRGVREASFEDSLGRTHKAVFKPDSSDQVRQDLVAGRLLSRSRNPARIAGVAGHERGALIEAIEDADLSGSEAGALRGRLAGGDPIARQDARDIHLFDWAIGNSDRSLGHNLGADAGRLAGFDQGIAFPRGIGPNFFRKQIDQYGAGIKGTPLSATERDDLLRVAEQLKNDSYYAEQLSPDAVSGALERIKMILDEDQIPDFSAPRPTYADLFQARA
jgi:hypothetical protein